jgi:ABC-type microcin C transport system duplicated ATPase subunit YejF
MVLAGGTVATDPDAVVLNVHDLRGTFEVARQTVKAVDGVSFAIKRGEIFGIVGESGWQERDASRPDRAASTERRPRPVAWEYGGRNLLELGERNLRRLRGAEISMVFRDPMTFLNPVLRVSEQIEEALKQHTTLNRAERRMRAVELMRLVGIALPERRLRSTRISSRAECASVCCSRSRSHAAPRCCLPTSRRRRST